MVTPHTRPYTVHGRSTLKDDRERVWTDRSVNSKRHGRLLMKWANCMNHLWAEMMSKLWFQLTEHCAVSCCMEINNSDAVRKSSTENFMCWWKQKHVSYYRWKGSHTSSMIRCIDNKQIQKKNEIGTPNSKLLLSLMVKARKRSELNPDPYTFNVNNYWCSALPYQRFAGDIIKSKKIMQRRIRTSASVLGS